MSSGNTRPLAVCDHDCAVVNDCQIGGCQCDGCGLWFCRGDLNQVGDTSEHLCDDCLAARGQEKSENDTEREQEKSENDTGGSEQGPAQAAQGQTY